MTLHEQVGIYFLGCRMSELLYVSDRIEWNTGIERRICSIFVKDTPTIYRTFIVSKCGRRNYLTKNDAVNAV